MRFPSEFRVRPDSSLWSGHTRSIRRAGEICHAFPSARPHPGDRPAGRVHCCKRNPRPEEMLPMSEVTRILTAIEQGDPQAAAQLLPLVYNELRKLAARRMAR